MADPEAYKEDYYFKFGEPGGADYRPGAGVADAETCGEIDPSNTHFNRAALNVDQYNYLASQINQIRKVRPLTFEDHYKLYPYRSGEMIVPKELYTIEWEIKLTDPAVYRVPDLWSAGSNVYPNGFYWSDSLAHAKEHYFRNNPAQSEADIIYTAVINPNVPDGPHSINKEQNSAYKACQQSAICAGDPTVDPAAYCHFSLGEEGCRAGGEGGIENGSRCGKFVPWEEDKGGPCLEYEDGKCAKGYGYWKSEDCCLRIKDGEGNDTSECDAATHGGRVIDGDKLDDSSNVQIFEIVSVLNYTGWGLNRGGGHNDWDSMDPVVGEYSLAQSYFGAIGTDTLGGRYPYDGLYLDRIGKTFHPYWLNTVNKLNAAVDAGYGEIKIPILDQTDYPAVPDDWFGLDSDGERNTPTESMGAWASLMEESGSALSDTIQSHVYNIEVEPVRKEEEEEGEEEEDFFNSLSPLKDPEGMAGQWLSLHPTLRRKEGTQKTTKDLGAAYDAEPEWDRADGHIDIAEHHWGNLPVDYYLNLSKTTKFEIASADHEIVDPLIYDEGIEYPVHFVNGIEEETMDDLLKQQQCSRGSPANMQACRWACKEWDVFGFDQYTECYADCMDASDKGRLWKPRDDERVWSHGGTLACSKYRLIDSTSFYFQLPRQQRRGEYGQCDGGWPPGSNCNRIWHKHFHEVERIKQERGLGTVAYNQSYEAGAGSLACFTKQFFCMDDEACQYPGGLWGYGKITSFNVVKRHVNNFNSELGCYGEKDSTAAMKRKDMLLHPAFLEDTDPFGYGALGGGGFADVFALGFSDDGINSASAGYAPGVQTNLYNAFTLPPYKGAGGKHGAGEDSRWVKDGDSIKLNPSDDDPVEGYRDGGVEKVHWLKSEDVQKRAKELGFHFEFRRLGVPYKMIEVKFDHEVSKFARLSGHALYTHDKWTSDMVGLNREYCQMHSKAGDEPMQAGDFNDDGTLKESYEPQPFGWGGGNADDIMGRAGCGLRTDEGGADDGGNKFTVGVDTTDIQIDIDGNPMPGPAFVPAAQVDPILQDSHVLAEVAGMSNQWLWRATPVYMHTNKIVFSEIDAPTEGWALDDDGVETQELQLFPAEARLDAHTVYPDATADEEDKRGHAGYWGQLGHNNQSNSMWWGGYDTHSLIFMGKPYKPTEGYAMGQTKNWAGKAITRAGPGSAVLRIDGYSTHPIIGGVVQKRVAAVDGVGGLDAIGFHKSTESRFPGHPEIFAQEQFYQVHIKIVNGHAGQPFDRGEEKVLYGYNSNHYSLSFPIIYIDYEAAGTNHAGNYKYQEIGEGGRGPNEADRIAEAHKGDAVYSRGGEYTITDQRNCANPTDAGYPCAAPDPPLDPREVKYLIGYKNWSRGGQALAGGAPAPYDNIGVWPMNVAAMVREEGVSAQDDEQTEHSEGLRENEHAGHIAGLMNVFDTVPGDRRFHTEDGDYSYNDEDNVGRKDFHEQKEGGCYVPGADLLLVSVGGTKGEWEEEDRGKFKFKSRGYMPHVKKTHQFALAASEAETEWIRPIGLGTLKHITKPFSDYDMFTTDFVKKQATFSCHPHKQPDNAEPEQPGSWGKPAWERTACDPVRYENPRADNGGSLHSGNLIQAEWEHYDLHGPREVPTNALVERDWLTFFPYDVTAFVEWGNDGDGDELWDNVELLKHHVPTWTAEYRDGQLHKQPKGVDVNGHTEGTEMVKFNSKKLSEWYTPIPLRGGGTHWKLGYPVPIGVHANWGDSNRLHDTHGQADDLMPFDWDEDVFGGVVGDGELTDQQEIIKDSWLKLKNEIEYDYHGAVARAPGALVGRTAASMWGRKISFITGYESLYGDWAYHHYGTHEHLTDWPNGLVGGGGSDVGVSNPSVGYAKNPHPKWCIGCNPGVWGHPSAHLPNGDLRFGNRELNPPTFWDNESPIGGWRFAYSTTQYHGTAGNITHDNPAGSNHRGAADPTLAIWAMRGWKVVNGFWWNSVGTYPYTLRGGLGLRNFGGAVLLAAGWRPWDSILAHGSWSAVHNIQIPVDIPGIPHPHDRAQKNHTDQWYGGGGLVRTDFLNVSLYDMLYHYDQTPILQVKNDGAEESFGLYKAEALKLQNKRNPSALMYQDYTDFYSETQYNQVFKFGEKDYQFEKYLYADHENDGYALSSLHIIAPIRTDDYLGDSYSLFTSQIPGDHTNMMTTFLRVSTEAIHFGGRNSIARVARGNDAGWLPRSWLNRLEPSYVYGGNHGVDLRPQIWRPVIKTSSMPMADTNFIPKSVVGEFGGSMQSVMREGKSIGVCEGCEQELLIGGTANSPTTAINFYIDNMIDLSPEEDALAVKVEEATWKGPDLSVVVNLNPFNDTCSCVESDGAWWCQCTEGAKYGQGGELNADDGYSQEDECASFCANKP